MAFNKNIPQPGDKLSQSQQDLLNNNLQLNTSMGINHYPFDDLTANNGKHNYIQLPNRTLPVGLVNGDETIYSKAIAGSGELVFTRGASGIEIQLTGPGTPSAITNGYTFLPGGILLQWGTTTASGTGTRNINFVADGNIAFPTACWHIFAQTHITTVTNGIVWTTANISTTGFALGTNPTNTPSGTSFSWLAIGN